MTTRTHTQGLRAAVVSVLHDIRPETPQPGDLTAADILKIQRELVPVDVPFLGRIYVYEPVSVSERDAYQKHMRFEADGITISMGGVVAGIIARVRDKAGRPLFKESDRQTLLDGSAETAMAIWSAIGADSAKPLSSEMVDAAEKK